MDDPFLMRMLERVADGNEQVQPLGCIELLMVAELRDGVAPDELHHEEVDVVRGAHLVQRADPGVTQPRGRSCLAQDALPPGSADRLDSLGWGIDRQRREAVPHFAQQDQPADRPAHEDLDRDLEPHDVADGHERR